MADNHQEPIFREVQRTRQLWIWAIVLAAAGAAWLTFIQQFFTAEQGRSTGSDIFTIIIWLLFGLSFPIFVAIIKLEITVTADGVKIGRAHV